MKTIPSIELTNLEYITLRFPETVFYSRAINLKYQIEINGETISDPEILDAFSNIKIFRDGDNNSHIFTVTSSVVRTSYTGLKDYKNIENNVKNKKKEIEDKYKKIQDRVDKAAKFTLKDKRYQVTVDGYNDDLDLDNETMQQLNLYVKLVTEQVIKMTTIHSLAFSYKLDALKDKMMQDKKILYIAMNKVLKDKKSIFIINFCFIAVYTNLTKYV